MKLEDCHRSSENMVKDIDKGFGVMLFVYFLGLKDYLMSGLLFFQANTVFRALPIYLKIKTTSWKKTKHNLFCIFMTTKSLKQFFKRKVSCEQTIIFPTLDCLAFRNNTSNLPLRSCWKDGWNNVKYIVLFLLFYLAVVPWLCRDLSFS